MARQAQSGWTLLEGCRNRPSKSPAQGFNYRRFQRTGGKPSRLDEEPHIPFVQQILAITDVDTRLHSCFNEVCIL